MIVSTLVPERLRERIAEEIVAEQARLGQGQATDFADYRSRCGLITGLKRAEQLIDEILQKEH